VSSAADFSASSWLNGSIPLGDALSLSKRMHRSVENIQSSHPHSVRNATFVRLCEKTFVRLRGKKSNHKGFTKNN